MLYKNLMMNRAFNSSKYFSHYPYGIRIPRNRVLSLKRLTYVVHLEKKRYIKENPLVKSGQVISGYVRLKVRSHLVIVRGADKR